MTLSTTRTPPPDGPHPANPVGTIRRAAAHKPRAIVGGYLPTPPADYAPLTAEELEAYRPYPARFLQAQRRKSWMLQLAERFGIVPILGKTVAMTAVVEHLMPDVFAPGYKYTQRFTCVTSDRELALKMLEGPVRKCRVMLGQRHMTFMVAAKTKPAAMRYLAGLGFKPHPRTQKRAKC